MHEGGGYSTGLRAGARGGRDICTPVQLRITLIMLNSENANKLAAMRDLGCSAGKTALFDRR